MINIKELFEVFSSHVASCKSAPFVCTIHASFESWFRAELNPVLWQMQYLFESITTNYTYPNSGDKADLCVKDQEGDIIFELKSFVRGQDANKKARYPDQIKKLENLITNSSVLQVITFTTFIDYTETRMEDYMDLFFTNDSWDILGPSKFIKQYPLYVAVTSMAK